ncbi:MAG: hypothetical protein ACRCT2_07970 [Plesiomonas shigelloides]
MKTTKLIATSALLALSGTASAAWTNTYVAASSDYVGNDKWKLAIGVMNTPSSYEPYIKLKQDAIKKDKPASNKAVIVINEQPVNVVITTDNTDVAVFDISTPAGKKFLLDAVMSGEPINVILSDEVSASIPTDDATQAIKKTKFAI